MNLFINFLKYCFNIESDLNVYVLTHFRSIRDKGLISGLGTSSSDAKNSEEEPVSLTLIRRDSLYDGLHNSSYGCVVVTAESKKNISPENRYLKNALFIINLKIYTDKGIPYMPLDEGAYEEDSFKTVEFRYFRCILVPKKYLYEAQIVFIFERKLGYIFSILRPTIISVNEKCEISTTNNGALSNRSHLGKTYETWNYKKAIQENWNYLSENNRILAHGTRLY